MESIIVSIEQSFASALGLPLATEIIIPIAAGTRQSQQATVCICIFDGSEVALIKVTRMPSITESTKNILCTASFFFGINIKSEVTINENTITTSKINIADKAMVYLRFSSALIIIEFCPLVNHL